ncbi:MAG: pyruvate formate-lyase-activating protein [Ruminococcus sp.]|jgi:pyruvate formate lyase activating enzyme|nr:pyruvate formate-lyase-activating protein [Ruminococcus sp.]
MNGFIHSTESFGTVDGPGIRFVIFMQGCPMRCLYCHNPDTWKIGSGKEVTAAQLIAEYEKYKEFMHNGGITVSGGEPLVQTEFVTELFAAAKAKNINTCLDTSGVTFNPNDTRSIDELIKYTDLVMLDIKHIDNEAHKKLTGHENKNILAFARYLMQNKVPLWVRHVIVPGITDSSEELMELGQFLAELDNLKAVDVLPYHDMGKTKYKSLGIDYPLENVKPLSKDDAEKAKNIILNGIRKGLKNKKEK